uniref:Uncharacterized protein n=1 Tax=Arcella intermedia TaxID=1963864 RepID=A0A6B2LVN7_9EUKA
MELLLPQLPNQRPLPLLPPHLLLLPHLRLPLRPLRSIRRPNPMHPSSNQNPSQTSQV